MRRTLMLLASLSLLLLAPLPRAGAHCQVPCGIYDDHDRVVQMREDVTTITKAVKEITALAPKRDAQSQNQLVRWVMTKEHHAERIMRTIADYFLAQKVAPAAPREAKAHARYVELLIRHHAVMVAAMRCKQSADLKAVRELGRALEAIAPYWPASGK